MRPLNIHAQREKEVRQIRKEQRFLWNEIHKLPLIKLEKPVRYGWYKEIVLTQKIDRYKSQKAIEEIFEIVNTYFWGRTKKECDKRWDCQRSHHFIYKDVPTISKKQFNKLSTKAQRLCSPFQYRECKKLKVRFYVRIPHNAYRIKYTKAYNTHRKLLDPTMESRLAVLENRLRSPGLFEVGRAAERWRDDWQTAEVKKSRIASKRALKKYKNVSARSAIEEASAIDQD